MDQTKLLFEKFLTHRYPPCITFHVFQHKTAQIKSDHEIHPCFVRIGTSVSHRYITKHGDSAKKPHLGGKSFKG